LTTTTDAEHEQRDAKDLDVSKEKWEREKREARRASFTFMASFIIIVLSILFSFDWSTSPPKFNPIIFIFGILFVILIIAVYSAAVDRTKLGERAEKASQRSQAILDSINNNLAKLGQLDDRLTQFESRLKRLEESRPPPPSL